jgi:L-lysine exporter family protein LysE/ArgO
VLDPAVAGLLTGLSLIVAIGAQNAYVLRQGLRRSHIGPVVAVCAVSDLVLIGAGVSGIGTLVDQAGWVLDTVRWLGVAFLTWYAVGSLRRALHPAALDTRAAGPSGGESRAAVLGKTVALTWLNPHVYLDTVILLGSVAAAHGDARWWFGLGAACGSVLWFTGLGFGARLLRRPFAKPAAWRALDGGVALVMGAIGVSLVV